MTALVRSYLVCQVVLFRCTSKLPGFSSLPFLKGDKIFDVLLDILDNEILLERKLFSQNSLRSKFIPLRVGPKLKRKADKKMTQLLSDCSHTS